MLYCVFSFQSCHSCFCHIICHILSAIVDAAFEGTCVIVNLCYLMVLHNFACRRVNRSLPGLDPFHI